MAEIIDLWHRGGFIMYVLFFLSVLSLGVVLFKVFHFFILGLRRWDFVAAVKSCLAQRDYQGALDSLATERHPFARVLEIFLRGHMGGASFAQSESLLQQAAYRQLAILRSYLSVLEIIAQVAPLIGLLGTVIGMIEAFSALEAAGARVDPSVFAGGIWTALLTTAAGLLVAIPSLFFFHILSSHVERTMAKMGAFLGDIRLFLQNQPTPKRT